MNTGPILFIYCGGILIASLLGGVAPLAFRLSHLQLQLALSMVSGLILGVALLHLLPQALETAPSMNFVAQYILVGLLAMFLLERFFCFHHHESEEKTASEDHGHHGCAAHQRHTLRWSGVAVGLIIHSVLNGVALAASVQVARFNGQVGVVALGTFLAIALHKPFDSLTISMLMRQGGYSTKATLLVNALFSLAVPCGVLLFMVGLGHWIEAEQFIHGQGVVSGFISGALAFSAGMFLCIALSDLLPELQFHHHDRIALSLALIAGVALAWGFPHDHHGSSHDQGSMATEASHH